VAVSSAADNGASRKVMLTAKTKEEVTNLRSNSRFQQVDTQRDKIDVRLRATMLPRPSTTVPSHI